MLHYAGAREPLRTTPGQKQADFVVHCYSELGLCSACGLLHDIPGAQSSRQGWTLHLGPQWVMLDTWMQPPSPQAQPGMPASCTVARPCMLSKPTCCLNTPCRVTYLLWPGSLSWHTLQHEATLSHGCGHSPHTPQRARTLQADEQGVEQEAEATRDRQPNAHHDAK